ncbi:MAG: membrane protein insertase YidC [Solirubrobacterales bacterium]|nr:membrane protein insertase YidC [Solirubrobacterales bacterium]
MITFPMLLANVLQPLIDVFEPILVALHDLLGSWGMSIVALTVIIRAVLLPLAVRQYRSMRKLADHGPEMKEIQARHKDDKQRQQQALMEFYKENKINPAASCLPLVAQIPVFLALFYLLQSDLKFEICGERGDRACGDVQPGSADFLFIPDLTAEATGLVLITLLALYVGSQLVSSVLMATTQDKTQRLIFLALPFVFIPFILNFPSGLLVYWITTNLWTIVQQYALRKIVGPPRIPEPGESPFANMGAMFGRGGRGSDTDEADDDAVPNGSVKSRPKTPSGARAASATPTQRPNRPGGRPPPPPRKRKRRSGRRR